MRLARCVRRRRDDQRVSDLTHPGPCDEEQLQALSPRAEGQSVCRRSGERLPVFCPAPFLAAGIHHSVASPGRAPRMRLLGVWAPVSEVVDDVRHDAEAERLRDPESAAAPEGDRQRRSAIEPQGGHGNELERFYLYRVEVELPWLMVGCAHERRVSVAEG